MKTEFIRSHGGADVLMTISDGPYGFTHKIVMTRAELQAHKVAIEEYQEEQPMRSLREGRGHE